MKVLWIFTGWRRALPDALALHCAQRSCWMFCTKWTPSSFKSFIEFIGKPFKPGVFPLFRELMASSKKAFSEISLCVSVHLGIWRLLRNPLLFFYAYQSSHFPSIHLHWFACRLYIFVCLKLLSIVLNLNWTCFISSKHTFQIFFLAYYPYSSVIPLNCNVKFTLYRSWGSFFFSCKCCKMEGLLFCHNNGSVSRFDFSQTAIRDESIIVTISITTCISGTKST